jgi:hypothetical protein
MEEINNEKQINEQRTIMDYEVSEKLIKDMTNNSSLLQNGYKTFSQFEKSKNFYINLLNLIFNSNLSDKEKKLACSTIKIFLKKNWLDKAYITDDEKMVFFLNNI